MRMRLGLRARKRGGAAVEFALLLPIFITLLSAILDYGMYFYVSSSATQAVRNGVRMAVTKADKVSMETVASEHAKEALGTFNVTCLAVEGCKFLHKHKKVNYSGDSFFTYQLTLTRPFIAPMGMVPSPKWHTIAYTMRYEY